MSAVVVFHFNSSTSLSLPIIAPMIVLYSATKVCFYCFVACYSDSKYSAAVITGIRDAAKSLPLRVMMTSAFARIAE